MALNNGPVAVTAPIHFGAPERPTFGCLHRPMRTWSGTRVVLCAPLGYEGQFSYLTFRDLAVHLADTGGAAVLHFDYDGCGDSAGSDEDSGRVAHWLKSIDFAIDEIKRQAPSDGPVVLVGLRAGALLAATAAAARDDVTGVALWAPVRSGHLFLREQRAFSAMAYATATAAGADKEKWGERGFEANGYVFLDETVGALEALDLKSLASAPAPHVLVLDRAEMPTKKLVPDHWRQPGTTIEHVAVPGYQQLMEPPWLSSRPVAAAAKLTEWITALSSPRSPAAASSSPASSSGQVLPGVTESAFWYDEQQQRFGILTEPAGKPRTHALIMITSTFGYRVGPNRMNVAAARYLAGLGISTLRIDLAGVGEVRETPALACTAPPNAPYHLDAVEDVRMAIAHLKRSGFREIALGGICAGAFFAWYSAWLDRGVSQTVLVNPETFVPIPFGLADHIKSTQTPPKWTERLRNEPRLLGKLALLLQRGQRLAAIVCQSARAHLPLFLTRTNLASRMHRLGEQRTRTSLLFSVGDSGITELNREMGPQAAKLERRGFLRRVYINGPDHSFTPRWANRMLIEHVATELKQWLKHTDRT